MVEGGSIMRNSFVSMPAITVLRWIVVCIRMGPLEAVCSYAGIDAPAVLF